MNVLKEKKGFTLLELMIVLAIISILAVMAQPMFKTAVLKSREAALKEDLFNLRNVLDQYYADNGKYPDSLDDLVTKGYMRSIPTDPITGSKDWRVEPFTSDDPASKDNGGICDIHSGSDKTGLDGRSYADW
jgi:general secretion pathway protein G